APGSPAGVDRERMIYEVLVNDQLFTVQLEREGQAGEWVARLASSRQQREFRFSAAASGEQVLSLLIDGRSFAATRDAGGLVIDGKHYEVELRDPRDRKSTRLNSSHRTISYAVFCLKKKK